MKKFIYLFAIVLLPVLSFSQTNAVFSIPPDKAGPESRQVDIFPNPNNGMFTVLFSKNNDIYYSMIGYDHTGMKVYVKENLNGNPVQVNLVHFETGIYYFVFYTRNREVWITERVAVVK